jgi:membrane-bound lytic murein transglycosylase B
VDPGSIKGSYAGAMGQPQFISSSYRRYAVDFDGDGKRDLWQDSDDVIGSVAHYFYKHGWQAGEPVAVPVTVEGDQYQDLLDKGLNPEVPLQQFRHHGVKVPPQYVSDKDAALIEFDLENGHEYWAGMKNFYVITRYNHSALYAMAVYQLSEEIAQRRAQNNAQQQSAKTP